MGERQRRLLAFRRGSGHVSVPLHQRLPRGVGSVLAVAFLALSAGTGFVLGGHFEAAQATHGEPRHIAGPHRRSWESSASRCPALPN